MILFIPSHGLPNSSLAFEHALGVGIGFFVSFTDVTIKSLSLCWSQQEVTGAAECLHRVLRSSAAADRAPQLANQTETSAWSAACLMGNNPALAVAHYFIESFASCEIDVMRRCYFHLQASSP